MLKTFQSGQGIQVKFVNFLFLTELYQCSWVSETSTLPNELCFYQHRPGGVGLHPGVTKKLHL